VVVFYEVYLFLHLFSRTRRRAVYLCIKKRVANLHHRPPTLGQNGWRLNKTHKTLTEKDREVGPDQYTLMTSSLYLSYTKGHQPLSSYSYPKLQFLLISSQSNLQAGSWSIKDTCITVFPKDPSSQHDQWIKPFLFCLGTFLQAFSHQSAKEIVLRLGTNATKFKGCNELELSSKNTCREDMLYRFIFLIVEGAVVQVRESSVFVTGQLSNNEFRLLDK